MANIGSQRIELELGATSTDDVVQTLADGAVVLFNVALGKSAMLSTTMDFTLNITNFLNGQFLSLLIMQGEPGAKNITVPAGTRVINNGLGVVGLSDDPMAHDILTFWKINDTIYCNYGKNYTPLP